MEAVTPFDLSVDLDAEAELALWQRGTGIWR
jgi:hypothetical protein